MTSVADGDRPAGPAANNPLAGATPTGSTLEATRDKRNCRKCGRPLVEGRAYELGGHRWHVDCFRCSVCHKQLDADTNMLVLGNGTIICNDCSYHCSICKKKIEDMAILTNDQAFCSDCFVCRNCHKRIDDLKYARTSQGIFCMSCHNALLARKRERQRQRENERKGVVTQDSSSGSARKSRTETPAHGDENSCSLPINASNHERLDADISTDQNVPLASTTPSKFHDDLPLSERSPIHPTLHKLSGQSTDELSSPSPPCENANGKAKETKTQDISDLHPFDYEGMQSLESNSLFDALKPLDDKKESTSLGVGYNSRKSREHSPMLQPAAVISQGSKMKKLINVESRDTTRTPSPIRTPGTPITPKARNRQTSESGVSKSITEAVPVPAAAAAFTPRSEQMQAGLPDSARSDNSYDVDDEFLPVPKKTQRRPISPIRNETTPRREDRKAITGLSLSPRSWINFSGRASNASTPTQAGRGFPASPVSSARISSPMLQYSSIPNTDGGFIDLHPLNASSLSPERVHAPALPGPAVKSSSNEHTKGHSHKRSLSEHRSVPQPRMEYGDTDAVMRNFVALFRRTRELETALRVYEPDRELLPPLRVDHSSASAPGGAAAALDALARVAFDLSASQGRADVTTAVETLRTARAALVDDICSLLATRDSLKDEIAQSKLKADSCLASSVSEGESGKDSSRDEESANPEVETKSEKSCASHDQSLDGTKVAATHAKSRHASPDKMEDNSIAREHDDRLETPLNDRGRRERVNVSTPILRADLKDRSFDRIESIDRMPVPDRDNNRILRPRRKEVPAVQNEQLVTVLDGSAPRVRPTKGLWPFRRVRLGPPRMVYTDEDHGDGSVSQALAAANGKSDQLYQHGASIFGSGANGSNGSVASIHTTNLRGKRHCMLGGVLEGNAVPYIVTRCFAEVESNGLDVEGIYRKSGSRSQTDAVLDFFAGIGTDAPLKADICAVTSAVKQYLRYLDDPVVPFNFYDEFISAGRSRDVKALQRVVQSLPTAHRVTILAIVKHLRIVAQHGQRNLMNSHNLAVVFAPTLAHDRTGEKEVVDMQARNDAMELMIDSLTVD